MFIAENQIADETQTRKFEEFTKLLDSLQKKAGEEAKGFFARIVTVNFARD